MPASRIILVLLLALGSSLATAADRLVTIDTRPGVRLGYCLMPREHARATLVLLTGGTGGIGLKDGVPTSSNFLVRSRDLLASSGFALDPGHIAGIVLTSTVTHGTRAAPVPALSIADIRVPVLVVHHARDECRSCVPEEAARIVDRLTRAPLKKFVMLDGGADARGDPCEPWHWHGFVGMEREAVDLNVRWIRDPR